MADEEYQLKHLERIYAEGLRSPFLKRHPLKPNEKYDALSEPCRIAYDDIMKRKYVIRRDPTFSENAFWSERTEVVAEYDSLEALVRDGWRLD